MEVHNAIKEGFKKELNVFLKRKEYKLKILIMNPNTNPLILGSDADGSTHRNNERVAIKTKE